jgi:nitrite reductase/ring-hydroxylating ferredoxin subunit|tara:strand:+ start:237 stop:563 length:327 start_codon:yes stop_codon:yes gene_type:complete
MSNFIPIARTNDIPPGERKRIEVNGKRITLFNIDGKYYAINDTCPHKGTAPLIRGTLDGVNIKCPNHGYRFNLKTGECNIDPAFNASIYSVKVEDSYILLDPEGTTGG